MPTLFEDLAEETSASNRRVADRLDEEARRLDEMRGATASLEELRQRAVASARQASDWAISHVSRDEGVWRSGLDALCQKPTGDDPERRLRTLLSMFETSLRLTTAARSLWEIAQELGADVVPPDEFNWAERRFLELATEVRRALEHRSREWQPADKDRLAQGLQLAREGKTVKADEARAWFRRTGG